MPLLRSDHQRPLLLAVLACLVPHASPAQAQEESPAPAGITPFALSKSVRHWGVDEGLPGERVHGIAQSPDGYLWINTSDHLSQFNGREFRSYPIKRIPGLRDPVAVQMAATRDGDLWINTRQEGLAVLHQHAFVRPKGTSPEGQFHLFAPAHDRGIIAVYMNQGRPTLYALTIETTTPLCDPGPPGLGITSIITSKEGQVWVRSNSGQLFYIKDRTITPAPLSMSGGQESGHVGAFFRLRDGSLAGCGQHGIHVLQNGAWPLVYPFPEPFSDFQTISRICHDDDGNFWILAEDAIWVLTATSNLHRIDHDLSNISLPVDSMIADSSGNVWMGTFRGLYQIRYTPFVTCLAPKDTPPPRVTNISEDGSGTLWFGCYGSICCLDPGAIRLSPVTPLRPFRTRNVAGHPVSGAWASTITAHTFLLARDGTKKPLGRPKPIETSAGTIPTTLIGLSHFANDEIWLSTYGGVFRMDTAASPPKFTVERMADLPVNQRVNHLVQGPKGDLYAVAFGEGVFRRKAFGKSWYRFTEEGEPTSTRINAITVDPQQRVWALDVDRTWIACWTESGSFHRPIKELGLGDARFFGLVHDDLGGLWLTSDTHGVARLDRDQLFQKLSGSDLDLTVHWFDRGDGLASRACSYFPSGIFKASDGRIWVASGAGASVADPVRWQNRQKHVPTHPIYIESLTADGDNLLPVSRSPEDTVHPVDLNPGTLRVEFQFTCLNYDSEANTNYHYRLLGYEDEWQDAGSRPFASYQNLPPGHYTFEVTSSDRFGRRNPLSDSLNLIVLPHWWQRLSTRLIALTLVSLLVYLIYRRRVLSLQHKHAMQEAFSHQLIQSQEEERKRIAAELHDSLGQHLLLIKTSSQLARRKTVPDSTESERFDEISSIASDALGEVRHIISNLRPSELDRVGLRLAVRAMADRITEHMAVTIDTDLGGLEGEWPEETEIAIYRIIQEALNNATKHANASTISVTTKRNLSRLQIAIDDDGNGFNASGRDEGAQTGGLGLTSMRERASLLGGNLHVSSVLGAGTSLVIEVPVPNQKNIS